ncbi:carbohydrate ABC transporter permease [Pleurocapsa sp. FMAR1]|uniref:carbohydrate ABC transporter permease n=1 Tax=Pleurocapsa sp. FMAR1 TaxID=3040204 RepID=UPI0029C693B5|nr:carbohydrate ABC transporter permease [Pleurocapsa sp. FMAR1]
MKQRSLEIDKTSLPFSLVNISRINVLILLVLLIGAIVVLFPLLVVIKTSFTSPKDSFTFANYQAAWHRGNFLLAFANSTLVALGVTALQIVTSALAGYALARLKFKGQQAVLLLILTTLVIPFQLLVIPVFVILKWAHLINSYWSLILPTAANGFGIFLMRQYFASIPIELEEAAALDGANRLQILMRIMLPLSRPALVTLFLFTFIGEWNDLFKPLVFTTRPELRTVQLALSEFQEQFTSDWSLLMAAVVIATIPVLILFLIGQKQLIQGIGSTGIKN